MFRTTFIGHQGWLFSSGDSHLLVDPLLCDEFGNGPAGDLRVYPPRRFDWDAFPPIDAVIYTHEHEDHFHLGSIARLDRRIPIYLSDRSSAAARGIVAEMGFQVRLTSPMRPSAIGRFVVLPFAQSMGGYHPGEWDTLALCIRDVDRHGGFFTTVDHRYAQITLDALRRSGERPALWTYPDNEMDVAWMIDGAQPRPDDTDGLVRDLRDVWGAIPGDLRPQLLLVCSNGLSFDGDLAWLNGSLFNRDVRNACTRIDANSRSTPCFAPLPGETVVMERGRIVERAAAAGFLAATEPGTWPRHDARATPPDAGTRFLPATGRLRLDDAERARLPAALAAFAAFLYGSSLFDELYELTEADPEGRRPTVAIELLEGEERRSSLWEYAPHACRFVEGAEAAADRYLAGATFWASDLLAVLEAGLPPSRVAMGRVRIWNARPERFRFDLFHLLFHYGHPLRQPEGFLRLYHGDPAVHRGPADIRVRSSHAVPGPQIAAHQPGRD
jgi:hypothetical protein